MHVSRHCEVCLSVGEHEQHFVFLYAECYSSVLELFTRIGEFDITFTGAKWTARWSAFSAKPIGVRAMSQLLILAGDVLPC